jgi:bacillithiol system protein YtxJ
MQFVDVVSIDQLDLISAKSFATHQLLFKHSTRCSISAMALNRIRNSRLNFQGDFYYLDLIQFRKISDAIAERWNVEHASPQILVIKEDVCIYTESHNGIRPELIMEALNSA